MKPEQAQIYKEKLIALRQQKIAHMIEQRGGTISRAEMAAAHFTEHEDSHAQLMTERDMEFAINEHETAELALIDAALERLEAGTYGQCISCGVDIAPARLEAAPDAGRCITCQTEQERRHNH